MNKKVVNAAEKEQIRSKMKKDRRTMEKDIRTMVKMNKVVGATENKKDRRTMVKKNKIQNDQEMHSRVNQAQMEEMGCNCRIL